MVEVPDRSAATLLPIIFKHVRSGTTIISDEWRLQSLLASKGMVPLTVNHSLNFVNPLNGAHTQSIESTLLV
uniref:ISXO2-like transposase domain-containing protein n=1 Tax=Amphimedon queenslandica TaxID=400682 RepID=A0A1X7TYV8_AMPQE